MQDNWEHITDIEVPAIDPEYDGDSFGTHVDIVTCSKTGNKFVRFEQDALTEAEQDLSEKDAPVDVVTIELSQFLSIADRLRGGMH